MASRDEIVRYADALLELERFPEFAPQGLQVVGADEVTTIACGVSSSRELFERGYRQGLVGIAELLQAQRQYNESRALYLELLGDLRQAAIALEAARGSSPHLNELPDAGGTP